MFKAPTEKGEKSRELSGIGSMIFFYLSDQIRNNLMDPTGSDFATLLDPNPGKNYWGYRYRL